MRVFACDNCGHAVFFENVRCLRCGSALAFLPDQLAVCAIEAVPGHGNGHGQPVRYWHRAGGRSDVSRQYSLCLNHIRHDACNFAVLSDQVNALCVSCRQTRVLPDLSVPGNKRRWYRIENAKRRLFYTLAKLRLVRADPGGDGPRGPVFEFLADVPGRRILTGHNEGVITLNIAEADDEERVRRRVALREPYRTLLGHLRHESGHYFWEHLISQGGRVQDFRDVFGDESRSYTQALATHYSASGNPVDWQSTHVSAYATAHPWEDWAETWAHYLHMTDLLETAASYAIGVRVPGAGNSASIPVDPFESSASRTAAPGVEFDQLVAQWIPVTVLLNSLNRSLGQEDAYPFAPTPGALAKLRFVHEVVRDAYPASHASE